MRLRLMLIGLLLLSGLWLGGCCSEPEPKKAMTAADWIAQPQPGSTKDR
jgi:hypothetical protein